MSLSGQKQRGPPGLQEARQLAPLASERAKRTSLEPIAHFCIAMLRARRRWETLGDQEQERIDDLKTLKCDPV